MIICSFVYSILLNFLMNIFHVRPTSIFPGQWSRVVRVEFKMCHCNITDTVGLMLVNETIVK